MARGGAREELALQGIFFPAPFLIIFIILA
jgi:hypothetical protein